MTRWFLLFFLFCGTAQAGKTEREVLNTPYGPLMIACEEKIMFGECVLSFGNRVLLDEDLRLSFDTSAGSTAPYYLIQVLSGSVSCPAMLSIVDLRNPQAPLISPEFGTCADTPTASLTSKGELRVTLPLWQEEGTARWSYKDGKVKRLK